MRITFKKKSFCAGGAQDIGRRRNHRGIGAQTSSIPERATDRSFGPAPFQVADSHCIRYRGGLHRLIFAAPPGRKTEKLFLEINRILLGIVGLALFAMPVSAQTAEEIVAKYVKTIGGAEKIEAIKTLRRTGRFTGGGGFEAVVIQENKRPQMARQEFSIQGMTGVTAYDGKTGWKIEPWGGKKDAEALGEEELKGIQEDADFDGPLVNYQQKGNKVEFVGAEPVEGTDAFKLKVTLKNGDVSYYFMDTDYFVPIKIESKRMVRGAEREFETSLGDYKEVAGVYLPHSVESGVKGSPNKSQITFEKIEANVALDDNRFKQPAAPAKPAKPAKPEGGKSE
jgi:hypothetical protein